MLGMSASVTVIVSVEALVALPAFLGLLDQRETQGLVVEQVLMEGSLET